MTQASLAAPSGANFAGQGFGLADIARLLRERGRVVRNVMAASIGLVILLLLVLPPRYSATAVVMLDPRRNNITDRSLVLSELPTDPASVQNQIQILTSRDLAVQVIGDLGLDKDSDFNQSLSPFPGKLFARSTDKSAQQSLIVDGFLRHLTAQAEGLSTAVSVSFSSGDAEKAARITNAVVEAYIRSQIEQKSAAANRTTAWLGARIAQLGRQVEGADAAVQAYKAAHLLNDSGQGTQSLVDQQLAAINTQLVQARADLAEKQASYDHVALLVKSGHAADVSQVVASPLIVQLREQQADALRNEAELDSRYGPRHPKRLAIESQLKDLDAKIEEEAERVAGSAANDLSVARAQVNSLEASLARARDDSNAQNLARVKLRALEASAQSTRSMYESFVTRLRETQDQDPVTTPDARIISHASVPSHPSFPPRLLMIGASIPAGFLLGLLCALVMEKLGYEASDRTPATSRPKPYEVPVVAVIPDAHGQASAGGTARLDSLPFVEAIAGMAQKLADSRNLSGVTLLADLDAAGTRVAVGLARALALQNRKVVLLDADFAGRAAARMMAADGAASELLDVLRGTAPLDGALARDSKSSALVLSGTAPRNPVALWSGPEIRVLLGHLRQAFDVVLLYVPLGPQSLPVARLANTVLVIGSQADRDRLQAAAQSFAAAGAASAGVVLAD